MNSEPMHSYPVRLQALNWLLGAVRPWLLQDRASLPLLPRGKGVDWKAVGDLAYVHNLEPLLFWVLSSHRGETDVPDPLRERWEQAYFGTFLQNERRLDLLEQIMDKCRTKGMKLMVLKGPALIGRIYEDPALRPMSDLDILCSPTDLREVMHIAAQMGCIPKEIGEDPGLTQHAAMYHGESRSLVEFHFRPYGTIAHHRTFMDKAWMQREWIGVGDRMCPVLSLDLELVFDVAHLAHHQFDVSFKHFIDIAGLLVLCGDRFHWDRTRALLRQFRLEGPFALTAGFLAESLQLPLSHLPESRHRFDTQHKFNTALTRLLALLDQPRCMDIKGVVWEVGLTIQNQEGLWNKWAVIRNRLFPFLKGAAFQCGQVSGRDMLRFYGRRTLFYVQRFLGTLTRFQGLFRRSKRATLSAQRAAAKNRITALLSMSRY